MPRLKRSVHLTDRRVAGLKPPASGNKVTFDDTITGFGCRVTAAGTKAWVLDYQIDGRQRRYTIGKVVSGIASAQPDHDGQAPKFWNTAQARLQAVSLRRDIDLGRDPLSEREAAKKASNVSQLADKFMAEYMPKRRASTVSGYQGIVDHLIKPALGSRRVASITPEQVEAWHARIAQTTPIRANRAVATLSRMMTLAVKWGMRSDNPCKSIEKCPENKRDRYASPAELKALLKALSQAPDQQMAKALLLLMLTGSRRSEVLSATWTQFDMVRGTWTKPASATKQKKVHIVPLSSSAMAVLASIDKTGAELFAGSFESNKHRLRMCWEAARSAAGANDLRAHDLRHGFASILASQPGASLPLIGAMLGHSTPSTTHRYAHLFDDPQRAAAERVGQFIEAVATGKQAEVINLKSGK